MKEYFVSFSIMFFAAIVSCFLSFGPLNFIDTTPFAALLTAGIIGGVFMSVIAYFRLKSAHKSGLCVAKQSVAAFIGYLAFFAMVTPLYLCDRDSKSWKSVIGWGVLLLITCVAFCLKTRCQKSQKES